MRAIKPNKSKNIIMRKTFNLFAFAALTTLGFWACKPFQGAAVVCSPDPIEVHADSVSYTLKATVPPKSGFKKKGTYIGEAKIGGVSQGKVVFSSEKYPNVKKTGIDTTIKFNRAFVDKMEGNALMIEQSYERKGKEFELPEIENLCQCCITTSRLVQNGTNTIFSKNEYVEHVPLRLEAKFNFPKDVFDIQEGDYNKADIKSIGEFISKKYPATKITIVGFASPEGPYKRNVMLSVNRSKEVQAWLTEQLKASGYESYLDSSFFDISVTHEDWEGFKKSIQSQPYDAGVKSQIIEIVSAGLSEEQRERQIMALVGGKDKVEHILAPLRRATIVVEGHEPRRTNAEIDKIAADFVKGNGSGNLKDLYEKEEWLFAISRQQDVNAKKALLEAFRDAFPSDPRAFNDLGAIALMQNDADAGLNYLEKAYKLKTNDHAVLNNLGAAYIAKNKYARAKESLESSLSAMDSKEANYNLGVALEKMARYNMAVEKFNKAGDLEHAQYNAGLSKLLMGDINGAKASLNEAIKQNDKDAWAYYLMAVAGARSNDPSTLTVNLRKAIQLESGLKSKASKDLEFRKYFTNSEFKAAIGG